jgi:hypothetical protein
MISDTVTYYCYKDMFSDTVTYYCYKDMFSDTVTYYYYKDIFSESVTYYKHMLIDTVRVKTASNLTLVTQLSYMSLRHVLNHHTASSTKPMHYDIVDLGWVYKLR